MRIYYRPFGIWSLVFVLLIGITACKKNEEEKPPIPQQPLVDYYRGMDLSFQPEIQDWDTKYFDENGQEINLLAYLSQNGVNLIRLKLWHTPSNQYNGLTSVIEFAKKVKANNMDILLDIHYSDTWADPGHQYKPQYWNNLNQNTLVDSIYQYTHYVILKLKQEQVLPTIVQIGNETNSGFLWNEGKVGGSFSTNWPNYIDLVKNAIAGVHDADSLINIMLHYAGTYGATWFFDKVTSYNLDFQYIGLSYYSIWHGNNLDVLSSDLSAIALKYNQKIIIVETAYPWTLGWNDWTNNNWGEQGQLIPGYEASQSGQKAFLSDLNTIIKNLPENKGMGFCYWAPDWVAFKGNEATNGSSWENATVFDFENKALPVINVFNP